MSKNNTMQTTMSVVCITNDGDNPSYFDQRDIELKGDDQRVLSEQISALNFRLRNSGSDYESDWHVAGDPTLLIILSGCMEIELRSGKRKQFKAGEMFIAQDYLQKGTEFNQFLGHRARVLGDEKIHVLHLKLSKQEE